MTGRRLIVALALAALALVPVGCGDSDSDKAKSAVEDYLEAVTKGDGNKACSLMTEQTRKNIEKGGQKCPETIATLNKGAGRALLKPYEDAKVENIKVNGDRAKGDIKVQNQT